MYVPFVWIDDYNDSIWNDTKFNTTHANVTIIPIKQEENLIFGYFRLYALILLAIFVILLLVITAIACYYDCENRRSSLPRDKYDSTKKGTVPTVTIKYAGEQSDIIDGKSIRVMAEESSVHSRTLRKRKMLIAARRSASTHSATCSELGDIMI
uniref:Uncharacterized protein n=1 Tax=Loa loa TaxID=7209 RepID=A0A1I7VGM7_LOALO